MFGNHSSAFDYWVVRLDAVGNLVWQKPLGGSNSDYAHSVEQTADGGFIIAGQVISPDGDITGNHGDFDYWVLKLDSLGGIVWQKTLGGSAPDYGRCVKQVADGGYIVVGRSNSSNGDVTSNSGYSDYWIVKLNSLTVGEKELSELTKFSLSPNPTATQLTIATELKIERISVTDITGKSINSFTRKSNTINVADLSNGIYFIKIEGEGQSVVRKFVKQ